MEKGKAANSGCAGEKEEKIDAARRPASTHEHRRPPAKVEQKRRPRMRTPLNCAWRAVRRGKVFREDAAQIAPPPW
jgi:hypothetical protein